MQGSIVQPNNGPTAPVTRRNKTTNSAVYPTDSANSVNAWMPGFPQPTNRFVLLIQLMIMFTGLSQIIDMVFYVLFYFLFLISYRI